MADGGRRRALQTIANLNDNDMKQSVTSLLFAMMLVPCHAQVHPAWGDRGDGTYANPILNADYSDPDVIRVGDKYFRRLHKGNPRRRERTPPKGKNATGPAKGQSA